MSPRQASTEEISKRHQMQKKLSLKSVYKIRSIWTSHEDEYCEVKLRSTRQENESPGGCSLIPNKPTRRRAKAKMTHDPPKMHKSKRRPHHLQETNSCRVNHNFTSIKKKYMNR